MALTLVSLCVPLSDVLSFLLFPSVLLLFYFPLYSEALCLHLLCLITSLYGFFFSTSTLQDH